jgi:hypothetical protein
MSDKKQTAVQWYIDQLEIKGDMRETQAIQIIQINIDSSEYLEIKRQALQMEREQTLDFTRNAVRKILDEDRQNPFNLEQYYNKTYGGQDE